MSSNSSIRIKAIDGTVDDERSRQDTRPYLLDEILELFPEGETVTLVFGLEEDGTWYATCPMIKGLRATGFSRAEAVNNARNLILEWKAA